MTTSVRTLLAINVGALLSLAAAIGATLAAGLPLSALFRDPLEVAGSHALVGLASNVGVLLWCATASICFCTAESVRRRGGNRGTRGLFTYFAVLTSVLLADDLLMIHDRLMRDTVGVGGWVLFPLYGLAVVFGAYRYADVLARTDYRPAVLALAFFAMSMGVDAVQSPLQNVLGQWRIAVEDGFKFLGIVAWTTYWVGTCLGELGRERGPA